jgi:hypothetical protein
MRIELTTSAWKAEVLPLNYTRNIIFYLQPLYFAFLNNRLKINGAGDENRTHNISLEG